ncbi:extracellular solute-binding protein [Vibrio sp. ZSDE26]|uniref:Extracellular solute-binding protein n=1 Tax=Vibrio amylolyticus TaxID=2847292 RepID=A0A9X2BKG3_9VIBR|nr:extracellular solute-binding protein [Vibrio amylolyticus]MCK6264502.1 extracellular solute-binding protein [Vibrio amylolyticus]
MSLSIDAAEIKIFTWEEYFSSEVIADFETQSGHTVSLVYFDSEIVRDLVVFSGKATAYDLFILDAGTLQSLEEHGLLTDISTVLLPNSTSFSAGSNEACTTLGIPYAFGSMGVGIRTTKVKNPIITWMDVFDYVMEHPQTVVFPADDIDTVAIALLALGFHPMTDDAFELKQAYSLLKKVSDDLLDLRNAAGYALDKKKDSQMDVAVFYSGEKLLISNATKQEDWHYMIPSDGTIIWYECLSSHRDKGLSQATIDFLNYLNQPYNVVRNAENMWFATTSLAVEELASPDYKNDNELFPSGLNTKNSYLYEQLSNESKNIRSNILSVLMKNHVGNEN